MQKHDGNIFGSYVLFNLSHELKKNNRMGGVVKHLIVFLQQVYYIQQSEQEHAFTSADQGSPLYLSSPRLCFFIFYLIYLLTVKIR